MDNYGPSFEAPVYLLKWSLVLLALGFRSVAALFLGCCQFRFFTASLERAILLVLGTGFNRLFGAMSSHGSAFQKSEESTHFATEVKAQARRWEILASPSDAPH